MIAKDQRVRSGNKHKRLMFYWPNCQTEAGWFWVVPDIVLFCRVFVSRPPPCEAVNSTNQLNSVTLCTGTCSVVT